MLQLSMKHGRVLFFLLYHRFEFFVCIFFFDCAVLSKRLSGEPQVFIDPMVSAQQLLALTAGGPLGPTLGPVDPTP